MSKKNTQRGFGLLGVLLVVIVMAGAGGVGVYVYHKNHKAKTASSTSSSSSTGSKTGSTGGTTTSDPYAGWKTYTDATYHYSFRYPATGWTIDTSSTSQITLLNPDKTVEIDYINPYAHDNGLASFTPVSISDLTTTGQVLKVVGGLYDGVTPQFNVVNSSLLSTEPLTIGQSSQFDGAPRFTDSGATYSGAFRAKSITSERQTSAWFSTPDAKTSLLVLESLKYQQ